MLAMISIDRIEIGHRLRGFSEARVAALIDSIAEVGVLNPITVRAREVVRGNVAVDGYGLIAGLNRLEACKRLGLTDIPAQVVELSDLQRQIAECDENLCGSNLTKSERALFTRRRKEAYEALHPETKHGGDRASRQVGDLEGHDRFTADTAAKTGQSERAVQRDAERGEKVVSDVLEKIVGTPLDRGNYLDALKGLAPDQQRAKMKTDLAAGKPQKAAVDDKPNMRAEVSRWAKKYTVSELQEAVDHLTDIIKERIGSAA